MKAQQQEQEKYKIIYLKDGRVEPHTLRLLLICCYQTLERGIRLFLTNCGSS
jgi:predicted RNA polymerase sigma factor